MLVAVVNLNGGARIILLATLIQGRKGEYKNIFEEMRRSGYVRVRVDGKIYDLSDEIELDKQKKHTIEVVVDRLVIHKRQEGSTPVESTTESFQQEEREDLQPYKRVAERRALYGVHAKR